MGLILTFLVISFLIAYLFKLSEDDIGMGIVAFIICAIISSIILLIISGVSYGNYIGLKQDLATIEQYEQEVKLYTEKGVVEFDKAKISGKALTDLKYQSYQKELSEKLHYLRSKIVNYNNTLISKKLLNSNWYFNWLIIAPDDDMIVLKMSDSTNRIK
jgi:ABC-type transport system involved in multi-copper enzyme maturation permease subunit